MNQTLRKNWYIKITILILINLMLLTGCRGKEGGRYETNVNTNTYETEIKEKNETGNSTSIPSCH